jgi:hypothetical protein
MKTISVNKIYYPRKFYQILMTVAFAINTGGQYDYILRFLVYVYIFDWFVMVSIYCINLPLKNIYNCPPKMTNFLPFLPPLNKQNIL